MVQKHCNDTAVSKKKIDKFADHSQRYSRNDPLPLGWQTNAGILSSRKSKNRPQVNYSNLERPCGSGMVPRCLATWPPSSSSTLPSISCHWLRMQGIMVENMVAHRKLVIPTCNMLHSYRLCHALSDPGILKKKKHLFFLMVVCCNSFRCNA